VSASARVELKSTARVTGNIEAPIVVMEEGAMHDGHCHMAKLTPEPTSEHVPLSLVMPAKA
jgi:cytoskeletal protein CcmA (bactofilin family)